MMKTTSERNREELHENIVAYIRADVREQIKDIPNQLREHLRASITCVMVWAIFGISMLVLHRMGEPILKAFSFFSQTRIFQ